MIYADERQLDAAIEADGRTVMAEYGVFGVTRWASAACCEAGLGCA